MLEVRDAGEILESMFEGWNVMEGLEGVCRKDGWSKGCSEGRGAGRMLDGAMLGGKDSGGVLRSQGYRQDAQREGCSVVRMQEGTLEEGSLRIWMFEGQATGGCLEGGMQ